MRHLNRREWLLGSGSTVALALLPARLLAAAELKPPVARVAPVKDVYFGETLIDRYRWMENDKDPGWLPYLKAENDYARSVLDALPGREALAKRIAQLSGDSFTIAGIQRRGERLFYEQRPAHSDNYKLFLRENGKDRLLIDPTAISATGAGHFSLDWWAASPDASHVVYGLSKDGSEDSVLHILRLADGKDLPETIANTESAGPHWLDDGSGFFYNQLTGKVGTPERYLDSQVRFHRLGSDPANDPILMKRGIDPAVVFDKIQMPSIAIYRGSSHALLTLSDVRPESRYYVAPVADAVAGKAKWVEVARFEDEVTEVDLFGDDIFLLANHGTPRGRIVRTSLAAPNLATASLVVPQGPLVIEEMARAKDGLYLRIMDGGISRLRRLGPDGRVGEIALPFDGTIDANYARPDELGVTLLLGGWLAPTGVWSVDPAGKVAPTDLIPKPPVDVSRYATSHAFATARDGTRIPYSLVYRKDMQRNGRNPAFISAYGSYGLAAYTPSFVGRDLALADAGAVVGYAYVRGGGEYGREWHKAGQLANKPNTWRDLIDVCEELIRLNYTAKPHLAIGGRSAGGITVGRAMTERPDLFAAVIDGVGWSNPLRYVVEQNGFGEEPEWGVITDPAGYKALRSIDSYQAVTDGTPYPAVLLTTGVTDPRVAPFHVGKMAARLQAATSSGKPVLLRVDYDAGHGIGSTRAQRDREAVDTHAFLLWQTGGMAFAPKT